MSQAQNGGPEAVASRTGDGGPEFEAASSDSEAARPSIEIYDTTLRDGSQLEGISLTVEDKLRIAEQLDWLGVHYIEAGWPGANPKDDELFRRAPTELKLETSTLVAFGSTRRAEGQGRQRRHTAASRGSERRDGVHRREVVGLPRHRSARHLARRRCRDGRRFGRVPTALGHERAVRRRALLRRLPPQSRVLVARARIGGHERCQPPRAVRHQRRRAAARMSSRPSPKSSSTSATT